MQYTKTARTQSLGWDKNVFIKYASLNDGTLKVATAEDFSDYPNNKLMIFNLTNPDEIICRSIAKTNERNSLYAQ